MIKKIPLLFKGITKFFRNYFKLFTRSIHPRKYGFKPLGLFLLQTLGMLFGIFLILVAFYSKDLPTPGNLQKRISKESTKILDRNGNLLYAIHGEENRIILKNDEIPNNLKNATIAVEDKNFYKHFGIDFSGIARATINNLSHGRNRIQGGSTLTQQFVKNALLTPKRTFARKVKEAILSIELEILYSKDEILTMYINEIPYGSNAYGVEAAANTYFGKKAKDLTLAESALLAALPKAPTYYSPYGTHTKELEIRKNYVLDRMSSLGYISKEEAEKAKGDKIAFVPRRESIQAPHFVMYVREILAEKYGEKIVSSGGLTVTTTLDLEKQKVAQEVVDKYGPINLKKAGAKNAAMVALDPKTGQILAMIGSKDYFNTDIDGNVNVTLANRQPGSSFKPVVYATGFKKEWAPASVLFDLKTDFGGGYNPDNYDGKTRGPVTIRTALANSLNIPAVKMLGLVGLDDALKTAKDFGITTFTRPKSEYGLSLVLGGGEVKLLELASAYGVFANNGTRNETTPILKVVDQKGKTLEEWKPNKNKKEVIAPEIAYEISSILSDNEARSAIFGSRSPLYIQGRTVAAKTGTTDAFRDAWTMGYTPSLVTGVWVGNNDNSSMSGTRGAGAMAAAPIFHDFMVKALEGTQNEEFYRPDTIQEVVVDALTAKLPIQGADTRKDIFASWQIPKERAFSKGTVKIDKLCGDKLATDSTPAEYIEERIYRVIHSEMPDNPNWEAPVRAWAQANGYISNPPTEYCTAHGKENQPSISITDPKNNALVAGTFNINSSVSAPAGVDKVEFYIDNILVGSDNEAPYSYSYDARNLSEGSHTISAMVYDKVGFKERTSITINVERDTQTPTAPTNLTGSRIGSAVILTWNASTDNVSVAGYNIYRSGSKLNANLITSPSYTDSTSPVGSQYEVEAVDTSGNKSSKSNKITI
ncbi:MAG: PBP1A family penicillin-binding protein [Candidatus Berkelbacteria bacterium]|nr:PBP1A family penicillin-binding protein [Candidatus Berkelbacteria bacterium]